MSLAELPDLLRRAEDLARDPHLPAVAAWRERTGGLAIGYTPVYVPRELFHAQGVLPVGLMGAGEDLEIIRGDAYYQSYICHIPRSIVEQGLSGALDALDGVVFPALCDVMRNLSGMWQRLFPDKLVRFLDVPQDFDPALGGAFYRAALEELAEALVARGALPLDPERLRASIALYDRHRALVEGLYELRRREPWKVPTTELYVVLRAGLVLPVEEHMAMMEAYQAAVVADETRKPMDQARVVVRGSFCEQPPLGLLRTLERAGCYIVDDDLLLVHRWVQGPVAPDGDPLDALVDAWLSRSVSCAVRWTEKDERKGHDLVDQVRRSRAGGVLFCAPSFCDAALLDQPMAAAAAEAEGVPWTAFKYAENGGQFQTIREQAGTFSDSIRLWGEEA